MGELQFFDANCVVGRHLKLQAGGLHTAGHLLDEMDHYGIAEALVLDCLSRENHPDEGNQRILETAGASPRLHPAWSALPAYGADEQAEPESFLNDMRQRRVRYWRLLHAGRKLPEHHRTRLP